MAGRSATEIAARNKDNYLKAKLAFNARDMVGCMSFYASDHRIRSRDVRPGREHIEQFLTSLHESWSDLEIIVEHAVAEGDWVMGHCTTVAVHAKPFMGVAPTNRRIRTAFWDLHRFNERGQIVETWNLVDSFAVMQQLGLVASHRERP